MAILDTGATTRTADDLLHWGRSLVDPAIRAAVDELGDPLRNVARYHFGWCDAEGKPTEQNGGKAIRATLALLCAEAAGGRPEAAVPAAAAVELVHNFSLVHDDVMDGDATRRHRATVWRVFGVERAVLTGDALMSLAWHVLGSSDHPAAAQGARLLSSALLDLVAGQSDDMAFESRDDVDVPQCLAMVNGKTAALVGGACALGAVFGGASSAQVTHLHEFGRQAGVSFQAVDDLLGIWGNAQKLGKPTHADLRCRKKSLPVVAALCSQTPAGQELARLYSRAEPLSDAEVAHAAELVNRAGGRTWCERQSEAYLARALAHLDRAAAEPAARTELAALARLIAHRDR